MRSKITPRSKRSDKSFILNTTLAVPVVAVALTGASALAQSALAQSAAQPDPSPHPLTLRLASPRVGFDHPVTVHGVGPSSDAGHAVLLQTAATTTASWHQLAAGTIGPSGRFSLRARVRRSGYLRAIETDPARDPSGSSAVAGVAPGGASAPVSPSRPVRVAAQLRVARPSHDVLEGDAVKVGGRLLPGRAGRAVLLQSRSSGGGWETLAKDRTGAAGGFRLRALPTSGRQRRMRVVFPGDAANTRSVAPAGRLSVYSTAVASWYDDAGDTGCGFHADLGVANVSLPCGTKVRFHYGGRSVTAVVDDRGPYVGGRTWDLNQNTAAALGFSGVGTVWATR